MAFRAAYRRLPPGELETRAREARQRMDACRLCPWQCGVNRNAGQKGQCRTGAEAVVSSVSPHFGEEAALTGHGGSGTIFFAWCNLHCRFCQNYELSAGGEGREMSVAGLADAMLGLQAAGCHNINLVSPSHVIAPILEALAAAAAKGLRLPLVYNTGGYDAVESLALLDGIVDIYMPDMKYSDAAIAEQYSGAGDYPAVNFAAVKEMHRQCGDLVLDEAGIAERGLLVRHLVLPEDLAGSCETARFLARQISENTYVNVMAQYRPCHYAKELPRLDRPITPEEYSSAVRAFENTGLHRLDTYRSRIHSRAIT
jgi:putative pyruvate formate lyase activating enzyme